MLKHKSLLLAWKRFVSFFLCVSFLVLFFVLGYHVVFIVATIIMLAAFIVFVNYNLKFEEKISFLSCKIGINKDELLFLDHNYQHRKTGNEYATFNSPLATDFDLFGKSSLFQYLNRCNTKMGNIRLAQNLCNPEQDAAVIVNKQEAVNELCKKNDFVQNFQTYSNYIPENGHEINDLQNWINEPQENSSTLRSIAIVLAVINVLWIFLAVTHVFTWGSLLLPLIISWIVANRQGRKIAKAHLHLETVSKIFIKYTRLFKIMEKEAFTSAYLHSLQQKLSAGGVAASSSLHSLFKVFSMFSIRDNVILEFLLNTLFLFDIHTYYRLLQWKAKYGNCVKEWFSALAEMEALCSFATFAFNNCDSVVYPTLSNDIFKIEAANMGHPLIHPDARVNNSIEIRGNPSVAIITGSNMAGKSTFLRTIAVNLLLAMNGAPVPVSAFTFTPCDIFSSIKIEDSLSNNESYFYAELVRIKEIIDHVTQHPRTLVILDEILRGTNTKDKQTGSLGLLEKLIRLNAIVIIATHDVAIGALEQKYPAQVSNYCFEVELKNEQLFFDYKLKRGISTKLNASFLMKKMEIID